MILGHQQLFFINIINRIGFVSEVQFVFLEVET